MGGSATMGRLRARGFGSQPQRSSRSWMRSRHAGHRFGLGAASGSSCRVGRSTTPLSATSIPPRSPLGFDMTYSTRTPPRVPRGAASSSSASTSSAAVAESFAANSSSLDTTCGYARGSPRTHWSCTSACSSSSAVRFAAAPSAAKYRSYPSASVPSAWMPEKAADVVRLAFWSTASRTKSTSLIVTAGPRLMMSIVTPPRRFLAQCA
mmetsp:Transcript_486/g.1240  ORF Transcript_486/g.1240 Transcript_486/m.1240 type:complete len:208 (+) Transcript_486:133-756(+)